MKRHNQLTSYNHKVIEKTELLGRRWLSERAVEVQISRPQHFHLIAGQTIRLVHENKERYFPIVSAPNDPDLSLCINLGETGDLGAILASAEIGAQFGLIGPHGYFIFSPSPRPPVFIGSDTGIAPFVAMARSGVKGFILVQCARRTEELYYHDMLRRFVNHCFACICDTAGGNGELNDRFHSKMVNLLESHLKPGQYDFYLCGWQQLIRHVTHIIDDHFPDSHVYTEVFF
jgi:benzoate/toluate 1,2-dioxygenase reductase component